MPCNNPFKGSEHQRAHGDVPLPQDFFLDNFGNLKYHFIYENERTFCPPPQTFSSRGRRPRRPDCCPKQTLTLDSSCFRYIKIFQNKINTAITGITVQLLANKISVGDAALGVPMFGHPNVNGTLIIYKRNAKMAFPTNGCPTGGVAVQLLADHPHKNVNLSHINL